MCIYEHMLYVINNVKYNFGQSIFISFWNNLAFCKQVTFKLKLKLVLKLFKDVCKIQIFLQ